MADNPFAGSWKLVSFEMRTVNDEINYPYGEDALGYIFYGQDGYMSVAFMNQGRPAISATTDLRGGTPQEKAAAFDTYFTYCGTYEYDQKRVIHHIEVSLYPNWTGKDQVRFYSFEGDRLILTTPPLLFEGAEQTGYLIWKRNQARR